jgi:hypothetical protein
MEYVARDQFQCVLNGQVGSSSDPSEVYLVGERFKSRPRHRLRWLQDFEDFLSCLKEILKPGRNNFLLHPLRFITPVNISGYAINKVTLHTERAIAQAVSRRLPTAAARVQTRVWSCGGIL